MNSGGKDDEAAKHRFTHFKHIVWTAWIIACLFTIAKSSHWLDWLDTLSMRLAGTWMEAEIFSPVDSSRSTSESGVYPLVFTITDELYETEFEQESPLDRYKLAQLISSILGVTLDTHIDPKNCGGSLDRIAELPELIAIDLDLSPIKKADEWTWGEKCLVSLLEELGSKTRVVLAAPIRVSTSSAIDAKVDWMQRLCSLERTEKNGIYFGYTELTSQQEYLLQYSRGAPTFAEQAAYHLLSSQASLPSFTKAQRKFVKSTSANPDWIPRTPCQLLGPGERGFLVRSDWMSDSEEESIFWDRLYPINWPIVKELTSYRLDSLQSLSLGSSSLKGRVVFIGGDYGGSDAFKTPLGELAGVYVHAAVFGSYIDEAKKLDKIYVFFLDVLFGILFGYLFHFMGDRLKEAQCASDGESVRAWSAFYLGALFFSITALLMLSGWLLIDRQIWMQPAPIVLGAYVDSQINLFRGRHNEGESGSEKESRKTEKYIRYLFFVCISMFAWIYIIKDLIK